MEYGNDAEHNSEHKSIGGALVDVFDAGVTLVRSEVSSLIRRLSAVAKAKALGVVLLLAALVPLTLALIFLILFAFYGLMRLGLGAWAAALVIALLSLLVAGALLFIGLRRLGAEVPEDEGAGGGKRGPKDHDRKDQDRPKDDDDHKDQGQRDSEPVRADGTGERATAPSRGAPGNAVPSDRRDETIVVTATGSQGAAGGQSAASIQRGGSQQTGNQHTGDQQGGDPSTSTPTPAAVGASTQGTAAPAGHKPAEPDGVEVSTTPTFRADMKKEGY